MSMVEHSNEESRIQAMLADLELENQNIPAALIELARDSSNPTLNSALDSMWTALMRQAAIDILPQIADSSYTATQIRSIHLGAALRRTRNLDYGSFLIKYELLKTIQREGLAQAHPANYTEVVNGEDRSFLVMAEEEAGIPQSVASDIMVLGDLILPWVQEHLGISRIFMWENIQTSNLRLMIPILRCLIGMISDTDDREPQQRVIDRTQATMLRWMADTEGLPIEPDNTLLAEMDNEQRQEYIAELENNRRVVAQRLNDRPIEEQVLGTAQWLIENAQHMTNRALADLTSNEDETPFDAYLIPRREGLYLFASLVTQEQIDHIRHALRGQMRPREAEDAEEVLRRLLGVRRDE